MMIQDFPDCHVCRDAGRIGGGSGVVVVGGGVPFTVVMRPLNGRLDWDLGRPRSKLPALCHVP